MNDVFLVGTALALIAYWCLLFRKAGFSFWWGLGIAVPGLNVVIMLMLLLREWPVQSELERIRTEGGQPHASKEGQNPDGNTD